MKRPPLRLLSELPSPLELLRPRQQPLLLLMSVSTTVASFVSSTDSRTMAILFAFGLAHTLARPTQLLAKTILTRMILISVSPSARLWRTVNLLDITLPRIAACSPPRNSRHPTWSQALTTLITPSGYPTLASIVPHVPTLLLYPRRTSVLISKATHAHVRQARKVLCVTTKECGSGTMSRVSKGTLIRALPRNVWLFARRQNTARGLDTRMVDVCFRSGSSRRPTSETGLTTRGTELGMILLVLSVLVVQSNLSLFGRTFYVYS